MPKADKKQRHKAKRQAKRLEARRRQSISPVKRLGSAPGEAECWLSDTLVDVGQMQIYAYKQGAGLRGFACFLIDRGVVGLKDAFTRLDYDYADFQKMVEQSDQRVKLRRARSDEARRWVAGAVRWTHENGMRLPKDWERTAAIIGGAGDWRTADTSAFAMEFMGHPEDLRQRLIGIPFDEFVRRRDIKFLFSSDAPYDKGKSYGRTDELFDEDDDDEEEGLPFGDDDDVPMPPLEMMSRYAAHFAAVARQLEAETRAWYLQRGEHASSQLYEAWRSVLLATLMTKVALPDTSETQVADVTHSLLSKMRERLDPHLQEEHDEGVAEILVYMDEDKSTRVQEIVSGLRLGDASAASG